MLLLYIEQLSMFFSFLFTAKAYKQILKTANKKMEEKRSKSTGEDEESEDSENIIINAVDGLPNVHPNFEQLELNCEKNNSRDPEDMASRTLEDLIHDEDLPMSVIVTNLDPQIFKSDEFKVFSCKSVYA